MDTQAVWKWAVPLVSDHFTLAMPNDARIVHVGLQHGTPCIWAIVTPTAIKKDVKFMLVGTGLPVHAEGWNHIGTVLLEQDALVLHLFHSQI